MSTATRRPSRNPRSGPTRNLWDEMADLAKKHGALSYVNCVADDVKPGKEK